MTRTLIILIISQLLIGCTRQDQPKTIDFGSFTIQAPAGWNKIEFQGIDSYVGGLTDRTDTLTFDYGWYSYDFGYEDTDTHLFTIDTINGKTATLIRPMIPGQGTIGMYIDNAYKDNHFNLIGNDIGNELAIFDIFKSVKFKDSDTTVNSLQFAQNFKTTKYPPSAKQIFKMNCASCHHISDRQLIGPGMTTIQKDRFDKWFFDTLFVYIPQMPNEKMGTDYHRRMFEHLTDQDIQLIKGLLKENE